MNTDVVLTNETKAMFLENLFKPRYVAKFLDRSTDSLIMEMISKKFLLIPQQKEPTDASQARGDRLWLHRKWFDREIQRFAWNAFLRIKQNDPETENARVRALAMELLHQYAKTQLDEHATCIPTPINWGWRTNAALERINAQVRQEMTERVLAWVREKYPENPIGFDEMQRCIKKQLDEENKRQQEAMRQYHSDLFTLFHMTHPPIFF